MAALKADALTAVGERVRPILGAYAELVFARHLGAGAAVCVATLLDPRAFVGGLLAVTVSLLCTRALGLRDVGLPFGCNALLMGLAVSHTYVPGVATTALLLASAGASALVVAASAQALSRAALPVLSLPFVVVLPLTLAAGAMAGIPLRPVSFAAPLGAHCLPLEMFGSILFLPRWDAGALVFVGIVIGSRIAGALATAGLVTTGVVLALAPRAVSDSVAMACGLNAALCAIAVGGIWFVPSPSSLLLASGASALSILFTAGLSWPFARLGVALPIAPFWLATATVFLALRSRATNTTPAAVDFVPGTPEENVRHARVERPRAAHQHGLALGLPFRGVWTCTQGVDGEHTHQGDWRHAFDFEVEGVDGELFTGDAREARSYHCYRLPVLAAADGTVVHVVDGLDDNEPGEQDLTHNWGNLVVVHHAPGLFSLSAHLSRGSVKVQPGQIVRRGDVIALCGSSGRAPRPHLHFQLQATGWVGAPTVPCRFSQVVRVDGDNLDGELGYEPLLGDRLRALDVDDTLAKSLALPQGFETTLALSGTDETLTSVVDLYGRWLLRSSAGGVLYFRRDAEGFVAEEALGPPGSVVHVLRAALARVPFEAGINYTDVVPPRWGGGALRQWATEVSALFRGGEGLEMRYRAHADGGLVVVSGESRERRRGRAVLATRCVLAPGVGPVEIEVRRAGWRTRAVLASSTAPDTAPLISTSPTT